MAARLRIARPAATDLESIYGYIADRSGAVADSVLNSILSRLEMLTTTPRMGMLEPRVGRDVRKIVVGNYLVIYREDDDAVVILRVVDGRRDIDRLLRQ